MLSIRYLVLQMYLMQHKKYLHICILYLIKDMLYMKKNIRYRFIHANKNLFISKSHIVLSISDIVFVTYFN